MLGTALDFELQDGRHARIFLKNLGGDFQVTGLIEPAAKEKRGRKPAKGGVMMKRLGESPGKRVSEGRITDALRKKKKMGQQSLVGGPGGSRRDSIIRGHGSPMKRRKR